MSALALILIFCEKKGINNVLNTQYLKFQHYAMLHSYIGEILKY